MAAVLADVAFLAAPTYRSRAYAQAMKAAQVLPAAVLFLPGDEPVWNGPNEITLDLAGDGQVSVFRPAETVRETLGSLVADRRTLADADVNRPDIVAAIAEAPGDTVVYSGLGGALLGDALLNCGKRFLHVHGGYAPHYRGSTAFYYSLLREGTMGATALWLGAGIDAGPILARRRYPPPRGVDIDRVGDPMIRAHLLCEVLGQRRDSGAFAEAFRDETDATTYHVIHPVLKHIALRRTAPNADQ